jgi:hypothetical protein
MPDLEVAQAGALDLLLLSEQLAADEGADQPAGLGRAEERADGSAGGGDSKLGHKSGVGLLEAVGGDDATEPFRIGAVLDAGASIGVGVDQREWLAPVTDERNVLRVGEGGSTSSQDVTLDLVIEQRDQPRSSQAF